MRFHCVSLGSSLYQLDLCELLPVSWFSYRHQKLNTTAIIIKDIESEESSTEGLRNYYDFKSTNLSAGKEERDEK